MGCQNQVSILSKEVRNRLREGMVELDAKIRSGVSDPAPLKQRNRFPLNGYQSIYGSGAQCAVAGICISGCLSGFFAPFKGVIAYEHSNK